MARFTAATAFAALLSTASGSIVARQTAASTTAAAVADPTVISECSVSSSTQVCKAGTTEFRIVSTPTGALPSSYTGCHKHATDLYCFYDDGEVQVEPASAAASTAASTTAAAAVTGAPTAVSDCHLHGVTVFCMWGASEYQVITTPTNTAASAIPTAFTDCHAHGADTFCIAPNGDDVEIVAEGAESSHGDHGTEGEEPHGENCHFHAGVEHCVGAGESESAGSGTRNCAKVDREYNIPLRIGLIFVILVTSAFGVYFPIFMIKWMPTKTHTAFLILKQFGTGIIISTAFIHLYTHAQLMFGNECLGALGYEGTTSAIVMAGIFLSFLVEYVGKRIVMEKMASNPSTVSRFSPETVTVLVLECGIIFHSILIGITLVVAGDTFFLTLFVVILFHQMFEGIALGTRIAQLGRLPLADKAASPTTVDVEQRSSAPDSLNSLKAPDFSLVKKILIATPFALVTPIGMAIGIGVLQHFNGNDRDTILAIGTLDALSAGILVWVGVVEMWAEDWMHNDAELLRTGPVVTLLAGLGLVAGMVIMSVLGKWA
ncbi:ZIP Zinc transporter [Colletotrichum graminicola]|uniref:ZIP Zinc transporter n=1 Tax=Colletotrichum graminicola (strain M1.001 / M2 / FGSC 10212) TaxID=645133 RepID=E3Q9H5_COLGM|nr:ZIP Zinc transporter [Colletotrichum graminicola M1.001]EFQ27354.1 ZIP Zinc transporter [Colletotrichum graminicola M1.001]WDK13146.1 ZIP Zinc transporter [Colletotrichum graminicola]